MFELSQFYTHCRQSNIAVIPYCGAPRPGATMRFAGKTAIFLDFSKIRSTRLLRGVCCHELGHAATGALHKVSSPYETVERSEYRANRWTAEHFLTAEDFKEAFSAGCRSLWELAEYFDLPEEDIRRAYDYWTLRRNIPLT
ncbi:MAG: ImmA/IrrE family metallo-endopeptidase [Oscillospiraceae bacterium]|nr:ImmA/IrrE family metallo-endopeptidase [Oscillospiraceae bacterium]